MNNKFTLSKRIKNELDQMRITAIDNSEESLESADNYAFSWKHAVTFVLVVAGCYMVIPEYDEGLSNQVIYEELALLTHEEMSQLMMLEVENDEP